MRRHLKEIRKMQKLTQLELAKLVNIERSYYTKIERGQRNIPEDIALKLKEVLNYKKDDIFTKSN